MARLQNSKPLSIGIRPTHAVERRGAHARPGASRVVPGHTSDIRDPSRPTHSLHVDDQVGGQRDRLAGAVMGSPVLATRTQCASRASAYSAESRCMVSSASWSPVFSAGSWSCRAAFSEVWGELVDEKVGFAPPSTPTDRTQ